MRHDLNYRRVLKTKSQYLIRYKNVVILVMVGFTIKAFLDEWYEKKGLENYPNINNRKLLMKNIIHVLLISSYNYLVILNERWYYTLFDTRLWLFIKDLLNISVLFF